jgi:hypothetical protein
MTLHVWILTLSYRALLLYHRSCFQRGAEQLRWQTGNIIGFHGTQSEYHWIVEFFGQNHVFAHVTNKTSGFCRSFRKFPHLPGGGKLTFPWKKIWRFCWEMNLS